MKKDIRKNIKKKRYTRNTIYLNNNKKKEIKKNRIYNSRFEIS